MKKKSLFAFMLSLIMTAAAVFALVGCGGEVDDKTPTDKSFDGAASTQTYDTQDAAAQNYISSEIDGKATSATFVGYEKSGDNLSTEQIAALNLGEIKAEDVSEAENGVITYTEKGGSITKTVKVVMLKTSDGYYYYTPKFANGATLTKGYFDIVLDHAKYKNMTESNSTVASVTVQGQTVKTTTDIVSNVTENAIYSKQKMTTMLGNSTTEFYIAPKNGELVRYQKSDNGSWTYGGATGWTTVDDFLTVAFAFDWSYFVKTSYGFELDSDKAMTYANDILGSTLDPLQSAYSATITGMTAKYYVVDGKLSQVKVSVSMKGKFQGVQVNIKLTGNTDYTYGNTVVETPDGLPE